MHLPGPHVRYVLGLLALLLLAITLWIICLLLLFEITRQLLDTLRFIVELGAMN